MGETEYYNEWFSVRRHSYRLLIFFVGVPVFLELLFRFSSVLGQYPLGHRLLRMAYPLSRRYLAVRTWVLHHVFLTTLIVVVAIFLILLCARYWLILWHNYIRPRLSGMYFEGHKDSFPTTSIQVMHEITSRPPGMTYVGSSPKLRWLGTRWVPVYLNERQRSTHLHVLGKTGSGKTQSVLWVEAFQDILDGKGHTFISGKGSDEEIRTIKALALMAERPHDLKVFALPSWNRPEIFTHTYNMVYVRPRTPNGPGGDPVATAERVFCVLPMGDNVYYNQQAQIMFRNLCRALHGMVDGNGYGIPFVMRDIAVCLKGADGSGAFSPGAGSTNGASGLMHGGALEYVLQHTLDREAAVEIRSQIARLGRDIHKVLSGLIGAVDQFLAPMVNSYEPDIIMEDVLQCRQIVYIQLPANLFKIQAPALGKVFLQDIQQEGSLRQVYRTQRDQYPFSVIVDEFARFADLTIVDSLSQLRDAGVHYTLAHQSLADLDLVSEAFRDSVWDNSRVKIILNQDNPALCEMVAKSIGTEQEVKHTIRRDPGPLFTSLQSGVASSREVESYKLHPNRIKSLARVGQAYLYTDDMLKPLCLGKIPDVQENYELPSHLQDPKCGLRLQERVMGQVAETNARRAAS